MKNLIIRASLCLSVLVCVLLFSGCSTFNPPHRDDDLSGMKLDLYKNAKQIKASADIIDAESQNVKVKQEAGKMLLVANDLTEKDRIARKMKSYAESLESKVAKLMNDKSKRVDDFFYWGIVFGGVLIAGAIALLVICYAAGVPNLAGLAVQIGLAGVGICAASGVGYYYFWIGITSVAVIFGVFVICLIIKSIRDNKSLFEVVRTSEMYKTVSDPAQADSTAKTIQSPQTRSIVNSIRKRDKLKKRE